MPKNYEIKTILEVLEESILKEGEQFNEDLWNTLYPDMSEAGLDYARQDKTASYDYRPKMLSEAFEAGAYWMYQNLNQEKNIVMEAKSND